MESGGRYGVWGQIWNLGADMESAHTEKRAKAREGREAGKKQES
jgi:hypothetical protein